MHIVGLPTRSDNYTWVLQSDTFPGQAWIVDPGESEKVTAYLQQNALELAGILLTHHHYDHTDGIPALLETFGNVTIIGNARGPIPVVTQHVEGGETIQIFDWTFDVLATPGHCHEHIVFYHPEALLCGDAMFAGGCGLSWTQGPEWMASSLLKLRELNDDCLVYCGHEYTYANLNFAKLAEPDNEAIAKRAADVKQKTQQNLPCVPSPLGLEKQTNPFLRFDSTPLREQLLQRDDCPSNDSTDLFWCLRQWKNRLDRTGELEMGLYD